MGSLLIPDPVVRFDPTLQAGAASAQHQDGSTEGSSPQRMEGYIESSYTTQPGQQSQHAEPPVDPAQASASPLPQHQPPAGYAYHPSFHQQLDARGLRPLYPLQVPEMPQRSSRSGVSPLSQAPKNYAARGPITSIACSACRKRKSKCSGEKPKCAACVQRQTECLYEMTAEDKSARLLRTRVERIEKDMDAVLEILLLTNKCSDRQIANNIANHVRKYRFQKYTANTLKKMIERGEDVEDFDSASTPSYADAYMSGEEILDDGSNSRAEREYSESSTAGEGVTEGSSEYYDNEHFLGPPRRGSSERRYSPIIYPNEYPGAVADSSTVFASQHQHQSLASPYVMAQGGSAVANPSSFPSIPMLGPPAGGGGQQQQQSFGGAPVYPNPAGQEDTRRPQNPSAMGFTPPFPYFQGPYPNVPATLEEYMNPYDRSPQDDQSRGG